ncbi:MAG: methyltransferase domain-containing protein [Acidobacteriota bacterium]
MFGRLKHRSLKPERLDTGDYTPQEYAKYHREMRFIHRVFGEIRALRRTLVADIKADGSKHVSVLDVGAGSGELLRSIGRLIPENVDFLVGAELSRDAALSIKANSTNGEVEAVQCDAMELPFGDESFDYVFSTLFLHHLSDAAAIDLLNEMNRVARNGFFIVDLHRSAFAYYFYKALGSLFLQRFTREDGSLSILKSFRPAELRSLANRAGLSGVTVKRSAAYRLVLSGKKGVVKT